MRFVKMNGLGNDYVFVELFGDKLPIPPEELSKRVSDRHFGIGSDGLVVIDSSPEADCSMRIWNADGTEAQMCGNALRCVAKRLYDTGRVKKSEITVETLSGIRTVAVTEEGGRAVLFTANMGKPLYSGRITVKSGEKKRPAHIVSVGNPHAVIFANEITEEEMAAAQKLSEGYPGGINVEIVLPKTEHRIEMRVWERGSGETLACGTGATAAAYAAIRAGIARSPVTVVLRGGELTIEYKNGTLFMSGGASKNYEGEYFPDG